MPRAAEPDALRLGAPRGGAPRPHRPGWLRALKPRQVLVFISSPSDCAVERETARSVVEALNARPEISRQRLTFRPLLWETLPPGPAKDGDFQARIDGLMRRFGYDAYGIYLGFMKGRLGTATPRHRSGTIEELESSLKSRRRTGMPSEVLFYFLQPEADSTEEVAGFRSELAARGFLTATVPATAFADHLTNSLFELGRTWNALPNVLRRTWRRFGLALLAASALFVTALIGADQVSRWQIDQAIAAGEITRAAELWRDRSIMMPISGAGTRRRVNVAALGEIAQAPSLRSRLEALAAWRRTAAHLPEASEPLTQALETQATLEIEAAALDNETSRGLALWRTAREAELWDEDPRRPQALLERLAAVRLIGALAASELPAQDWPGALLRSSETDQLRSFARQVLARRPGLSSWRDRRQRVAVAVLAESTETLGRLAAEAIVSSGTYEQPELEALIRTAPAPEAAAWLRTNVTASLETYIVGHMVSLANERGEPAIILALADLLTGDALPTDAAQLLQDLTCPPAACAEGATRALIDWSAGAPLTAVGLELLLPALDPGRLSAEAKRALASKVTARLQDDEAETPVMIAALSALDTDQGRRALRAIAERHASGEISFGFAQREALIDHLRRQGDGDGRLALIRALMLRSEDDRALISEVRSFPFGGSVSSGVARAYLDGLADLSGSAADPDRALLERIIDRAAKDGDELSNGLGALGRALHRVPEGWRDALFAFPSAPLLDGPWEPIWDRRRLMLTALIESGQEAPEALAWSVFTSLPNDAQLAREFARLGAELSPDAGRAHFRAKLDSGDLQALSPLGRLNDVEAFTAFVADWQPGADLAVLPEIIAAVEALDGPAPEELIDALVARLDHIPPSLLRLAGPAGIDRPRLRQAAESYLEAPISGVRLAGAVTYLGGIDPDRLWAKIGSQPAKDALTTWLTEVGPADWLFATQEFAATIGARWPEAAGAVAETRRLLVVDENGAHLPENAETGWMGLNDQSRATSPLLALLAHTADPRTALAHLARLALAPPSAEVLGAASDAEIVFRAYATWLAAIPARSAEISCLSGTWFGLEWLDDTNPLVARAASALVLANPAAALQDCDGVQPETG